SATITGWLETARRNLKRLLHLLDALHEHAIPEPVGDHDSLVEFDRRRVVKEQLIHAVIGACLGSSLAVTAFRGTLGQSGTEPDAPAWAKELVGLERALYASRQDQAREALRRFIEPFRGEPLLFMPLAEGHARAERGDPRVTLRT